MSAYLKKSGWGLTKPTYGATLNYAHPLSRGLRACVLFSEGGGNLARNAILPAALSGTASPLWIAGKFGRAAKFDGATQYYLDSTFSWNAGSDITIAFWNNKAALAGAGSVFTIGNLNGAAGTICQAHCPYSDGTLYWDYSGQGVDRISTAYGAGNLGKWTHVCLVGGVNFRAIYLNGIQQASASAAGTAINALTGLWVGAWPVAPAATDAAIDHLMLWNRQLSAAEVLQLYVEPFVMLAAPTKRFARPTVAAGGVFGSYFYRQVAGMGGGF